MNDATIGLVLCGGQSSRMGLDKGLIQNRNMAWVVIALKKLNEAVNKSYISLNLSQTGEYKKILSENKIIFDASHLNVKGPLLGILSAHLQFPEKNIIVLACDMLEIEINTIKRLLGYFTNQSAICFSFQGKPEPLLGIYSSQALKQIYKLYYDGNLMKFSMMHVLELVNAEFIMLNESEFRAFKNYNSPTDLPTF